MQTVLREAGVAAPVVAYVGVANGDDKSFFAFMADTIRESGAGKIMHALISAGKADLKKARDILESADIVSISGGDVELGMQVLEEKRLTGFLAELYRQGKVFFGTSAGSIMLAREWVRWADPEDDNTAELFPCLGLAPVICDTHAEQDDWEELKVALSLKKDDVTGYGITTGSALKVNPDGSLEALGGAVYRYAWQNGAVARIGDILPVDIP